MGQIDADKMYDNVMKWDWGNSDGDIYHDPNRESITYRTNLARLMNQLKMVKPIKQKNHRISFNKNAFR
jgi:hypothetical protein